MKKRLITLILIFVFSSILWVSVSLSEFYSTTVSMPIKYVNVPYGYAVGNSEPKRVTLSLKGQGWELITMALSGQSRFFVSASGDSGHQRVMLRDMLGQNPWISSTMQLIDLYPKTLEFRVEKIVSKKVKIVPDVGLNLKENYGLTSEIKLFPDSVVIYGPRSIIADIRQIRTKHLHLDGVEKHYMDNIELENIYGVETRLQNCMIEFDVEKIVEKAFTDVFVATRNVPLGHELLLYPNKISIVVRGGVNQLANLSQNDIRAFVNYSQALDDNLGVLEPYVQVPEHSFLIDKKPAQLEYIIKQR